MDEVANAKKPADALLLADDIEDNDEEPGGADASRALAGDGAFGAVVAMKPAEATTEVAGAPLPCGSDTAAKVEKDAAGRITSFTGEGGYSTTLTYDAKGRMTSSTLKDSKGNLAGLNTVRYDDENGSRISVDINYDFDGSVMGMHQSKDYFKDGKLTTHSEKELDSELSINFDDQGREIESTEKRDGNETSTTREYKENGNVVVESRAIKDFQDIGRTHAEFDKDGKQVGPQISQRFDEHGDEVARVETTKIEHGVSKKYFENGEFKSQVDITKSADMKTGIGHTTEVHRDADGKVIKTIAAEFFPRQPYLPTKITVTNPDGTVKESLEITYATQKGRLTTNGPVALIQSISHTVPPAEAVKTDFATRRDQVRGWNDLFKASKDIDTYSIPIGREPRLGRGQYGPPVDADGRRTQDVVASRLQQAA